MVFLLSAAGLNRPATNVAIVAPRNPSAKPIRIAITMPSCGGDHTSITTTHEPMIIPVARRGNFRAMVSNSATETATKGMSTAAKTTANEKSNT